MKEQLLTKFHQCFIQFVDELVEQFPNEPKLHILRVFLKDNTPPLTLMEKYCTYIIPYKEHIDKRDENFFLSETAGFSKMSDQNLICLKSYWQSDQLDEEDKEVIWKWFSVFNTIALKYSNL